MSEEESPTRYMLPEQAEGLPAIDPGFAFPFRLKERTREVKEGETTQAEGDHSLLEQSLTEKKRRKKKDKKKDKKKLKEGKYVQFHDKVTLLTISRTLKHHLQELDLVNEDDYLTRVSAFALKRKSQKEILKYQHQYRPLTPRRLVMLNHVRETLSRVNGNPSSSTPQTSTPTRSSSPSRS